MPEWTFWDYEDASGENVMMAWRDSFRLNVRTKIRSRCVTTFAMTNAEGRPREPRWERLQGPYTDLMRTGFEKNGIRHILIACYGNEGRGSIWLLAAGTEHNDRYRPPGILDTALERRANVLAGVARVRPTCLLENS